MWLLYQRPDHERRCSAEGADRPQRRRHQACHGRQHLPLRRLHQHCCCCAPRKGAGLTEEIMQTFQYVKATSIDKALASASGTKFIAGGTTLVDLMKLSVEQPKGLV